MSIRCVKCGAEMTGRVDNFDPFSVKYYCGSCDTYFVYHSWKDYEACKGKAPPIVEELKAIFDPSRKGCRLESKA